MKEYIMEMPLLLKIALCMYIISAGLNAMYNWGYMFAQFISKI